MNQVEKYTDQLIELAVGYGPKLLLALLTLLFGLWIIKAIVAAARRAAEKKDVDPSLRSFLFSSLGITLRVLLVISVAGMIGIEMTSFIAVLGAAGLAIGMALSGTLQNFAGGVMILLFRPYKVGDYIEAQGHSGTVREIQIFNTILKTPDNKTIIIPNAGLANGSMVNYSTEAERRVDFTFGIGYEDDIDAAKAAIADLILKESRIKSEPEPFIAVSALADSSVNIVVRVWVDATDYWPVHFAMLENVKKEFDTRGISIPYPQHDVHVHGDVAQFKQAANQ